MQSSQVNRIKTGQSFCPVDRNPSKLQSFFVDCTKKKKPIQKMAF